MARINRRLPIPKADGNRIAGYTLQPIEQLELSEVSCLQVKRPIGGKQDKIVMDSSATEAERRSAYL